MAFTPYAFQQCISDTCAATYEIDRILAGCEKCGSLLDIEYEWDKLPIPKQLRDFEKYWNQKRMPQRNSGVWRFHELLPFAKLENCLTVGEGQTVLQENNQLAAQIGISPGNLFLQYEGLNPSGSFKDNGMTAALTHAAAKLSLIHI